MNLKTWNLKTWKQILTRKHHYKVGNLTMNLETSILAWKIPFPTSLSNSDVSKFLVNLQGDIDVSKLIMTFPGLSLFPN